MPARARSSGKNVKIQIYTWEHSNCPDQTFRILLHTILRFGVVRILLHTILRFGVVRILLHTILRFGGVRILLHTVLRFWGVRILLHTILRFWGVRILLHIILRFGGVRILLHIILRFGGVPGYQLNLVKNCVEPENFTPEIKQEVKDELAKIVKLPSNLHYRKKLARKIHDLNHRYFCLKQDFHIQAEIQTCKCKFCKNPMSIYHQCPWRYSDILDKLVANKLSIYLNIAITKNFLLFLDNCT